LRDHPPTAVYYAVQLAMVASPRAGGWLFGIGGGGLGDIL
jgi:hypothetical protein